MSPQEELELLDIEIAIREKEAEASKKSSVHAKPPESPTPYAKQIGGAALGLPIGAAKGAVGTTDLLLRMLMPGRPERDVRSQDAVLRAMNEQFRRTDEIIGDNTGYKIGNVAGEALNPYGLKLQKLMPVADSLGRRVGQGMTMGGFYGGSVLEDPNQNYWTNKALDVGGGATIGGTIPLATSALKSGANFAGELWKYFLSPNAARNVADDYMMKIVGPENMPKLVEAARRGNVELVPGSRPTTAEALAGIPEASPIVALQNQTAMTPSGVSARFGQRLADQQGARERAIRSFAKTEGELESAIASRSAAADINYGEAFDQIIRRDKNLRELWKNPFFKKEVSDAWDLFRANYPGRKLSEGLTPFLHYVKIGLDKQLGKTGNDALSNAQRRAVTGAKDQLVDWLKKNPAYDEARLAFQEASVPINQMQVGQELLDRLRTPTGTESPGAFIRAMQDAQRTIKSSTGMPRQQFGQVLTGEQEAAAGSVVADLERKLSSMKPLQPTSLGKDSDIAAGEIKKFPSLLERPFVVANWLLGKVAAKGGRLEKNIDEINAFRLLHPEEFAKAFEILPARQKQNLVQRARSQGYDIVNQGLISPSVTGLLGD